MPGRLTGQDSKETMEDTAHQDDQFIGTKETKMMTTTTTTTTPQTTALSTAATIAKVNNSNHRRLNPSGRASRNLLPSSSLLAFLRMGRNTDNRLNLVTVTITILTIQLAALAQLTLAVMNLPDGIENVLGFVPKSTFQCERDGYFGDIDNDCRIFHLCQRQYHPSGRTEWRHWTYACGNQTMFNQLTLTCAFVDEAIPCKHASQFQYLNEVIHKPAEPFLTDADVTSGISYYSNRVMSDGARARAFEDSQLLAQIGGGQQQQQQQQVSNTNSLVNFNSVINHNNFQQQGSSISTQSRNFETNQLGQSLPSIAEGRANIDGNNINSIDQPVFLPNENTFQPLFNNRQQQQQQVRSSRLQQQQPPQRQQQPQFQLLLPATGLQTQTGGQAGTVARGNLIENHAFQLQHHQHASPTQSIAFAPPSQQAAQSVQAATTAATTTATSTTTTAAATTTGRSGLEAFSGPNDNSINNQLLNNQFNAVALQSVQRQSENVAAPASIVDNNNGQPSSFTFSISTNHQPGAQSEQPAFSQSQGPLLAPPASGQQSSFQRGSVQTVQLVAAPATTPSTTTTTAAFTTTFTQPQTIQTPTAATTTLGSAPLATTTTTISQTAPTTTTTEALPVPVFTTRRLQPPTTSSSSSTTTSAERRPNSSLRRRQEQSASTRQQQPQPTQRQRDSGRDMPFERAHVGFQSTRLSSQTANRQPSSRASDDTPLVMRRSTQSSASLANATPVAGARTQPAPAEATVGVSGQSTGGSQALFDAPNQPGWSASDFWRRSTFDTQLMTPKFESLLTRRRV